MSSLRRFLLATALVTGLLLVSLAGSFVYFTQTLAMGPGESVARADGIVVLTGGASRIDFALSLLAREKARRLLISGVNPSTTREDIRNTNATENPANAAMFDCCIDIDRIARSTIGNARESAEWVRRNDFSSVIVVTSSYHMPRAMLEFRRILNDTTLMAYPVVANPQNLGHWWQDGGTFRLLVAEYLKFAAAIARVHIVEPYLPFLLTATELNDKT